MTPKANDPVPYALSPKPNALLPSASRKPKSAIETARRQLV
jgi:hypothetical protein